MLVTGLLKYLMRDDAIIIKCIIDFWKGEVDYVCDAPGF
jgi:hypothetical protein